LQDILTYVAAISRSTRRCLSGRIDIYDVPSAMRLHDRPFLESAYDTAWLIAPRMCDWNPRIMRCIRSEWIAMQLKGTTMRGKLSLAIVISS